MDWNKHRDNSIRSLMSLWSFHKCEEDHCCYVKKYVDSCIILDLYIDDMLIVGANKGEIERLKKQLSENFEMKDLGPAKEILGMRIS